MTSLEMIEVLEKHAVELEFKKVDGTVRKMKATRESNLLFEHLGKPTGDSGKEDIDAIHNNVTVFDLEKKSFRSFNMNRLMSFRIIE